MILVGEYMHYDVDKNDCVHVFNSDERVYSSRNWFSVSVDWSEIDVTPEDK